MILDNKTLVEATTLNNKIANELKILTDLKQAYDNVYPNEIVSQFLSVDDDEPTKYTGTKRDISHRIETINNHQNLLDEPMLKQILKLFIDKLESVLLVNQEKFKKL